LRVAVIVAMLVALMTHVAVVLVDICSGRCGAVESVLCRPVGVVVAARVAVIVAVLLGGYGK